MKLTDCLTFIRTPTTYCSKPGLLSIWPTKTLGLNKDSVVTNNSRTPVCEGTFSPLTAHLNHKDIELLALPQALHLTRCFPTTGSVIIHQIVQVDASLQITYVGGRTPTDLGPYLPYHHAPQVATTMSKSGRGTTAHFCPAFSSLMHSHFLDTMP